jgi:hypothetical protein
VLVVLLALACTLLPAGLARGDGDPASDVLLGENVYYPYSPTVSRALQQTLAAETQALKRSGLPLKVALISSPVDLGVVPDLFGHPQRYADFLDQEISYRQKQPLLVVMRAGYGVQGLTPQGRAAAAALPPPTSTRSDDLAHAAITAVARIAKAEGHPIRGVPGVEDGGGGTNVLLIVLGAAAVAVGLALIAVTVQRRRGEVRPA